MSFTNEKKKKRLYFFTIKIIIALYEYGDFPIKKKVTASVKK